MSVTYVQWEQQKEKKRTEKIFEALMIENFPKLMLDIKTYSRKLREHRARCQKSTARQAN